MIQIDVPMPKSCLQCVLAQSYADSPFWDAWCKPLQRYIDDRQTGKRQEDCPLKEVKDGHWIDVDRMQMHDLHGVLTWGNSFKCTECQFKTFAVEGHITQYRYCPNCGARMNEEANDGQDDSDR